MAWLTGGSKVDTVKTVVLIMNTYKIMMYS